MSVENPWRFLDYERTPMTEISTYAMQCPGGGVLIRVESTVERVRTTSLVFVPGGHLQMGPGRSDWRIVT